MSYKYQREFPLKGSIWNPSGEPSFEAYAVPSIRKRSMPYPAGLSYADGRPVVTVVGTVRNEATPLDRSLYIWMRQVINFQAELLVLDDGSSDEPFEVIKRHRREAPSNIRLRYVRVREPDDPEQRSCTLVFNLAARQLVRTPLVMFQWWDRIPGSVVQLQQLVEPHFRRSNIVTSAISRHIGGSSSVDVMGPAQLKGVLALVAWKEDPGELQRIAGPIGGHCKPLSATESSGFCLPIEEFTAIGGYDERYVTRASYANVELWRRLLQSGLEAMFLEEPVGSNYHQSHACPTNREKDTGCLSDLRIKRNIGVDWGALPYLEEL